MGQTFTIPASGQVLDTAVATNAATCLQTLQTCFSGTSAPSSPVAGQLFFNTTTKALQQYDGTTWRTLFADISATTGVSRLAQFFAGDGVAATQNFKASFFYSPYAITVESAGLLSDTAEAADSDANYYTLKLRNLGTGGAGTTDLCSKHTALTGGTAITANTAYDLGTISNANVALNEILAFRAELTGAPTSLNTAKLNFILRYKAQ